MERLVAGRQVCLVRFEGCGDRLPTSVPGRGESGREELSVAARRDLKAAEGRTARRCQETETRSYAQHRSARRTV